MILFGTITYNINGVEYTQNLLAANNVEPNDFLLKIFEILLVIIIIAILLSNSKKGNKRKYKYSMKY